MHTNIISTEPQTKSLLQRKQLYTLVFSQASSLGPSKDTQTIFVLLLVSDSSKHICTSSYKDLILQSCSRTILAAFNVRMKFFMVAWNKVISPRERYRS